MYPTRVIHLLLVAIGFVAVAQATFLNNQWMPRQALKVRQASDEDEEDASPSTGAPASSPSASEASSADADPTSDEASTPTNEPSPSPSEDESPSATPSDEPESSTTEDPADDPASTSDGGDSSPSPTQASPTADQTDPPTSSESEADGGNDSPTSASSEGDDSTPSSASQVVSTIRTVVTLTNESGEEQVSTSETVSTSSPTADLNTSDDDNSGGGMPENTKKIVIGVVCGVGGAIILGALAFVGWRMWGRKKRQEENDNLMDYNTAGTSAFNSEPKNDATSGSTNPNRSPFQTTLENYHNPNKPVNASSNF